MPSKKPKKSVTKKQPLHPTGLMKRIVVYTKDLSICLGCSDRHARRLLKEVREAVGKPPRKYVTVQEAAMVLGLPPDWL